eukprot:6729773-Pyramimonas_sp.AAC.2
MYEDMARIAEHCGKKIPGGRQTVGLHFCHIRGGVTLSSRRRLTKVASEAGRAARESDVIVTRSRAGRGRA